MKIPFLDFNGMHSPIADELNNCFLRVTNNNWYLLGNELKEFEQNYGLFNNVKYVVGVSNGLDALHLSLRALGIGVGDEVIVPSNTYIATALAVSYVGATPVFVEPNLHTYNIDPLKIESAITSKTKVIMPVHLYGQACDMDGIMRIANQYGLLVVEDNAQAHGAAFGNKLTGSWGDINGTSFYPGKNLGALGDAGGVTTENEDLAQKVQTLRNYGSKTKYYNEVIGYNMRMDELQAAFLNVKLKYLNAWTQQRQQIASWYNEALQGVGDLVLPYTAPKAEHVFHLYVVRSEYRDLLQSYLSAEGIGTLIHYPVPPHLQEAYSHLGHTKGAFPIAEKIADTCLSLPLWPGMEKSQVHSICSVISNFFQQNKYEGQ
jgi:dTDP-4-amino-4,6-dideoxygalactose transaminase